MTVEHKLATANAIQNFETFLLTHKHDKSLKTSYTHTRIPSKELCIAGGSYYIPDEDLDEFYKLYSEKMKTGRYEHLTEKQRDDQRVICIDLDFKYGESVDKRQHTSADIADIVCCYAAALAEVTTIPEDMQIPIYVMEKPDVNTDDEKYTKDGIHIIFGVASHFAVPKLIRNIVLEHLPPRMEHLPVKNSWDDVMDDNITRLQNPVGWTLYGSRKPANDKYELTHVYHLKDSMVEEQQFWGVFDPLSNIELLSVRNRNIAVLEVTDKEALDTLVRNKVRSAATTRNNSPASASACVLVDDEQDYKTFIDLNCKPVTADKRDTWWWNAVALMRQFEGETAIKAVHYYSSTAPNYDYEGNKHKVDDWLDKYDEDKEPMTIRFKKPKPQRGVCHVDLQEQEEDEEIQPKKNMIIGESEDKNFTTMCEKIVPFIRKVLLYCREEWYTYDDTKHLWSLIKEPQKIIKKYMFKCIAENNKDVAIRLANVKEKDVLIRATLVDLQKKYLNLYTKIESLQNITLVKRDLMISLCDHEFVNKLDQHEGKLIFKDGIYDIATNTFTAGLKYEHYLSYTLPYEYRKATALDKAEVKKKVMEICANEPWRYNYYMEILGYSMLGKPDKEQVAFFMVGMSAGNGKSTLLEALTQMMPNYVVNLNSKTFSKGNADFKKSINSVKGARIAWINEVEKVKQDIDMIKQIADGKAIKNPVLFKQTEELIQILAKLFFVSNGELRFASDEGIKRRYRYVEFVAKFHTKQVYDALEEKRDNLDFEADTAFADLLVTENGFFALLELICEGSRRWIKNKGLNVPAEYAALANAACEKNDEFAEFVSNNIVKSSGDFVARFEIEERYKEIYSVHKMHNEKTDFREYMASKGFVYQSQKSKKVKGKVCQGCYMNCKVIPKDDDVEEE